MTTAISITIAIAVRLLPVMLIVVVVDNGGVHGRPPVPVTTILPLLAITIDESGVDDNGLRRNKNTALRPPGDEGQWLPHSNIDSIVNVETTTSRNRQIVIMVIEVEGSDNDDINGDIIIHIHINIPIIRWEDRRQSRQKADEEDVEGDVDPFVEVDEGREAARRPRSLRDMHRRTFHRVRGW
jgi:hypothetical protein